MVSPEKNAAITSTGSVPAIFIFAQSVSAIIHLLSFATPKSGKHASAIHETQKQGRLDSRILPAGPQRASPRDTQARR